MKINTKEENSRVVVRNENSHNYEERFNRTKLYLDSMGDALLVLDTDMKIVEINKVSCKLWNCLANEFYGKHILELFSVQEREKYLKNVEVGIKSGSVDQFETVVLTSDKVEVPVEIKSELIKYKSGIVELLLTVRDITERKEKELRFAENKNKHRLLFENLKEGYAFHKLILDKKGTPIDYVFLDVNPVFEDITGFKKENIIGKKVTEVVPRIKEYSFNRIDTYGKVVKNKESIRFEQYSELLERWYSVYVFSSEDCCFITLFHDITKERLAVIDLEKSEKRYSKLNETLEEIVLLRTDELNLTINKLNKEISERITVEEKLTESLLEKEVLMNEIHHRVKNNLQVVWGLLDLQERRTSNKKNIEALKDSKTRVNSIALIHESLCQNKNFSEIKFNVYLNQLINDVSEVNCNGNPKVKISLNVDDINLSLDKSIPLGLLINEILSNCYKYAFLNKKEGIINISLNREEKKVCLIISDNGIGFNFSEVSKSKNGIGLKLISNLCRQIDAELTQNSVLEEGTTYQVKFYD